MSVYEKKATQRKGNNKKKGQAHQNITAWKPNKNSKITRTINALPVYGLCDRCTEVIMWKKKYKKYKPLTAPKKWYEIYIGYGYAIVCAYTHLLSTVALPASRSRSKKHTMCFATTAHPTRKCAPSAWRAKRLLQSKSC